jgi:hypothetical protein
LRQTRIVVTEKNATLLQGKRLQVVTGYRATATDDCTASERILTWGYCHINLTVKKLPR